MGDAGPQKPTPENNTLFQAYEWNVPADQNHWKRLQSKLPELKAIGITNCWIPPACKAANASHGNGFDIYDLWDLGEFDQKGSRSTKWGSKEDLLSLVDEAQKLGVGIYLDTVLNHKAGADATEKCRVIECANDNRLQEIGKPLEIEGWLRFDFSGRGDKYSSQKYHSEHFSGTDYDAATGKKAIFRILGEKKQGWSKSVGTSAGNDDFLMFADLDYAHPEVVRDVINWGEWIVKELKLKGMRLDAVQHYSQTFTINFIKNLESVFGKDKIFLVGEMWIGDRDIQIKWLDRMKHSFHLFDSPLLNTFSRLSKTKDADLRKVFDRSLIEKRPDQAVTVVTNHDTQPGQTVETLIEGFFKPIGYCLILLRQEGYPCVFYGDLYGTQGELAEPPACGGKLSSFILARKLYAYGEQNDYFDQATCIGFVRRGTWDRKDGLACVMSNGGPAQKRMFVGSEHKGEKWTCVIGWQEGEVVIGHDGYGTFPCGEKSVAVWVNKEAEGRDQFGKFDDDIYKT